MNTDKIEVTQQEDEAFEAMSAEWKNGDECVYCGDVWSFVSILSDEFHGTAVIFDRISEELKQVDLSKIERPETPQQREERERDEFINGLAGLMVDLSGYLNMSGKTKAKTVVAWMNERGYLRGLYD